MTQKTNIEELWIPAGKHTINASFSSGGQQKKIKISVLCNKATATTANRAFQDCVKQTPRRVPFVADSEIRNIVGRIKRFKWKRGGVYLVFEPTPELATVVTPDTALAAVFSTNADYLKLEDRNGWFLFPDGEPGSPQNPAKITGIDRHSAAFLTTCPTFLPNRKRTLFKKLSACATRRKTP
jgi:hypothetical protein